jgi:hypothetical protein
MGRMFHVGELVKQEVGVMSGREYRLDPVDTRSTFTVRWFRGETPGLFRAIEPCYGIIKGDF